MPRFYVGYSSGEKEVWKASNVSTEANFLITVELAFSGEDPRPAQRYKAALLALGKDATHRRQLSRYAWGFRLESRLNEVFQTLVDHLGIEHHSYTATDLALGEGLAFDAEKRVVCEIYSRNWMA